MTMVGGGGGGCEDSTTITVDFVCQANLGRSDGGRETWAYQFIPALLHRHPEMVVRVYGQRLQGKPDTSPDLRLACAAAEPRLRTHFFPATRTPWPLMFSMARQFVALKRHEQHATADLTIAVGSVVELLIVLLSRPSRRSFKIVWLRTILVDQKAHRIPPPLRRLARWVEVRLLSNADLLIANGDDIAAYYRAHDLQVTVIKNAVEVSKWRMPPPTLRKPLHVAYVGRLSREKGVEEFLTVARLIKSSPDSADFVFHVAGSLGLRHLASEAEARGDIVWHGAVSRDELARLLSKMDVCVAFTFASANGGGGGTSNAMMEQLAAGRVMLAWDNVIFRQWLDHRNAYLVPQGNAAAAAAALRFIANDRENALRRAEAGKEVVRPFDVPAMMSKFEEVTSFALRQRNRTCRSQLTD